MVEGPVVSKVLFATPVGCVVELLVGFWLGTDDGQLEGEGVGGTGVFVGSRVGSGVGARLGSLEGLVDGHIVGVFECGAVVEGILGIDGELLLVGLGSWDGSDEAFFIWWDGYSLGVIDGDPVGILLGDKVGSLVGSGVG